MLDLTDAQFWQGLQSYVGRLSRDEIALYTSGDRPTALHLDAWRRRLLLTRHWEDGDDEGPWALLAMAVRDRCLEHLRPFQAGVLSPGGADPSQIELWKEDLQVVRAVLVRLQRVLNGRIAAGDHRAARRVAEYRPRLRRCADALSQAIAGQIPDCLDEAPTPRQKAARGSRAVRPRTTGPIRLQRTMPPPPRAVVVPTYTPPPAMEPDSSIGQPRSRPLMALAAVLVAAAIAVPWLTSRTQSPRTFAPEDFANVAVEQVRSRGTVLYLTVDGSWDDQSEDVRETIMQDVAHQIASEGYSAAVISNQQGAILAQWTGGRTRLFER